MISSGEASLIARRYQSALPVDVFALISELGLGPVFLNLPDNISGLIRKGPGGTWEIGINKNHSRVRQRFTGAHEVAHFVYHRDRLERGGGTSDSLAYRVDINTNDNPHITWVQEYQANNYAANLLIPTSLLSEALARGAMEEELTPLFDVSRAAMRIKLGKAALAPARLHLNQSNGQVLLHSHRG